MKRDRSRRKIKRDHTAVTTTSPRVAVRKKSRLTREMKALGLKLAPPGESRKLAPPGESLKLAPPGESLLRAIKAGDASQVAELLAEPVSVSISF